MRIQTKAKGNRNELECVKILEKRFGKGFKRTPYSGSIFGQSNRHFGSGMSDEQKSTLAGDIITPPGFRFSIEHKAYKNVSFFDLFNEKSDLKSWFKQCCSDADFANKSPMLIVKYNGKKRIVYIKEKMDDVVFSIEDWHCYWLSDLLKLPDDFFFKKSES